MKEIKLLKRILKNAYKETLKTKTKIDYKDKGDIVTNNDILVEKYIIKKLQKYFPNDKFLTEEHFSKSPLTDDRTWVIDPIDGTSNYAYNLDLYVIQVALLVNKEIELSYIYMPFNNSHYYAIKDGGAYLNDELLLNDNIDKKSLFLSLIGLTHENTDKEAFMRILNLAIKKNFKVRMLGSVGYELAKVSDNTFDMLATNVSNLWDIAPGILLVREAGFLLLNEKGEDYKFGDKFIVAIKHQKYFELLKDVFV